MNKDLRPQNYNKVTKLHKPNDFNFTRKEYIFLFLGLFWFLYLKSRRLHSHKRAGFFIINGGTMILIRQIRTQPSFHFFQREFFSFRIRNDLFFRDFS